MWHTVGHVILVAAEIGITVFAALFFGYVGYLVFKGARDSDASGPPYIPVHRHRGGVVAPYRSTARAFTAQKVRDAIAAHDWVAAERLAKQIFPNERDAIAFVDEKRRAVAGAS